PSELVGSLSGAPSSARYVAAAALPSLIPSCSALREGFHRRQPQLERKPIGLAARDPARLAPSRDLRRARLIDRATVNRGPRVPHRPSSRRSSIDGAVEGRA